MLLILALALTVRLPLFNQSLWLDEAIQALALKGHYGPILSYALSDFQPPLYHFLGIAWTRVAGYSEIALRMPSLLSGLLTVAMLYKIGGLLAGKKAAVIGALLGATNPLFVYYSQEGRTYMMTTFFATAAMYYFLHLLKSHRLSATDHRLLYVLFTAAMLWTSYLSWSVAAVQAIYLIFKKRWDILILLAASCLTLVLWLPSLLTSLTMGLGDAGMLPEWRKVVGGTSIKSLVLTWVKWNMGRISFDNNLIYGIVAGGLVFLHAAILYLQRKVVVKEKEILSVLGAPLVLAALISLFVPAYSYTRVLFLAPVYILMLALALVRSRAWVAGLCIMLNLIFLGVYWSYPQFHRENWRQAVTDINAAGGAIAMPSKDQLPPLIYYGVERVFEPRQVVSTTDSTVHYIKYVESIYDPERRGHANLQSAGYELTSQKTYPGLQVDTYELQK